MRELIERLEKSEAGGRELDRDLAKLIDRAEWDKCANWASMPCGAPPDVIDRDALRWLPTYTTSLDAALALAERVLPDHDWSVGCLPVSDDADHEEHHHFGALLYSRYTKPYDALGHGATPALALCIAVLTALRTTEQHSQPTPQQEER